MVLGWNGEFVSIYPLEVLPLVRSLFHLDSGEHPDFSDITIKIASPEKILSWSYGEVKKAETINYRTFKPERDGLFCERIFGPTKDWECYCGKYKRIKNRGITCDRCGVEVTESRVRRERMGHIHLVSPCSHIWFVKGTPNRVAMILGISSRDLEKVVYYAAYVVIDPGDEEITGLSKYQLLTEEQYQRLQEKAGAEFKAGMGAEAVKELLEELELEELSTAMKAQLETETGIQKRKTLIRRLSEVENFLGSGNHPEWMILDVLPVLPPDLRPLVPLDGGRFATSDLNDLYRTVINRNNRLKKLMELRAPNVILKNEKRMLQEAVDALLDNGRRGYTVKGVGNRPLKSLSDSLKGKLGRFRQNLLGKRVDYSGRAVIVVGPDMKLHQCGLPKKMALELFKPFIIQRLEEKGFVHTTKSAKRLVEQVRPEVWDTLDEVIKDHPVLLNRAPTLHRLGIQAFQPLLIEGNAITIHPLVCAAFNADFDGDQMAVHVPISVEAQLESRILMMSTRNILSPAQGNPLATPSRDIILGCYVLTKPRTGELGEGMIFADLDDAITAYQHGVVGRNAKIEVRFNGEMIDTTIGRIIFNKMLPSELRFVNKTLDKKSLSAVVAESYKRLGNEKTVIFLDKLKDAGFLYATIYGISICIDDIRVPEEKLELIGEARKEVASVEKMYKQESITEGERYNKVIDIWTQTTDDVADRMMDILSSDVQGFNSVFMMADSGARASKTQIRQMAGMRGLMSKPQKKITGQVGEIIESPIIANFREGLTVQEYFISTHGGRKGLADTALKTADAGYLTRRLVDVAHDLIVVEDDCGTLMGIDVEALKEGEEIIESLRDRILGRVCLEDIYHPITGEVLAKANTLLDEDTAQLIEDEGVRRVRIRSVLTCETKRGVCALCYGRNLATGELINRGEAIGVIAAQSIGEPGTQLTLRTFHIGGTASRIVEQSVIKVKSDGKVVFERVRYMTRQSGEKVVVSRNGEIVQYDDEGRERVRYTIPYGSIPLVEDGQFLHRGEPIYHWDPYSEQILTDVNGTVRFVDIDEGVTMREEVDSAGKRQRVIIEHREKKLHPTIAVVFKEKNKEKVVEYDVPTGAYLMVRDGDKVRGGDTLVKIPREIGKTRDITGGLPRVAELFEARRPKDPATISEIDGEVEFGGFTKGKRKIIVHGEVEDREYLIPQGKHVKVQSGDYVSAGQQLCEGSIDPHDILRVKGDKEVQEYLVNEIQEVYRLQGVHISDKHMEVIVRKMLRKVKIDDPGDSDFLPEQDVDRFTFREENERLIKAKKRPATARPILQGITKASLSTGSFISAASFQETTRVLTEAAVAGRKDELVGLKENVIMGHLIPAGTGIVDREKFQTALAAELVERKRVAEKVEAEEPEPAEASAEKDGSN